MFRIQRSNSDGVVFHVSGQIAIEDIAELERLLSLEVAGEQVVLDLHEVTLIARDAVKSLAGLERETVKLNNVPGYIREWMDKEHGRTRSAKKEDGDDL